MTIKNSLILGQNKLLSVGIKTADLDSLVILEYILNYDRCRILAYPNNNLTNAKLTNYKNIINKRSQRIPLSYLIKLKQFYGLDLKVNKNVFIPRPESEEIVNLVISLCHRYSDLIDIGTGSGALAIAIKKYRPDLNIFASDISIKALCVARYNAIKHNQKINFIYSNLFSNINRKFDTVIANLPYLRSNNISKSYPEIDQEPKLSLMGGGKDGLSIYRIFIKNVINYVNTNGYVMIESFLWQQPILQSYAKMFNLIFIKNFGLISLYRKSN